MGAGVALIFIVVLAVDGIPSGAKYLVPISYFLAQFVLLIVTVIAYRKLAMHRSRYTAVLALLLALVDVAVLVFLFR